VVKQFADSERTRARGFTLGMGGVCWRQRLHPFRGVELPPTFNPHRRRSGGMRDSPLSDGHGNSTASIGPARLRAARKVPCPPRTGCLLKMQRCPDPRAWCWSSLPIAHHTRRDGLSLYRSHPRSTMRFLGIPQAFRSAPSMAMVARRSTEQLLPGA